MDDILLKPELEANGCEVVELKSGTKVLIIGGGHCSGIREAISSMIETGIPVIIEPETPKIPTIEVTELATFPSFYPESIKPLFLNPYENNGNRKERRHPFQSKKNWK